MHTSWYLVVGDLSLDVTNIVVHLMHRWALVVHSFALRNVLFRVTRNDHE